LTHVIIMSLGCFDLSQVKREMIEVGVGVGATWEIDWDSWVDNGATEMNKW